MKMLSNDYFSAVKNILTNFYKSKTSKTLLVNSFGKQHFFQHNFIFHLFLVENYYFLFLYCTIHCCRQAIAKWYKKSTKTTVKYGK